MDEDVSPRELDRAEAVDGEVSERMSGRHSGSQKCHDESEKDQQASHRSSLSVTGT
jgi:hypothetical protein